MRKLFEILNKPARDQQANVYNPAATTAEDIFLRNDKGQAWRAIADYKGEIHKLSLLVDCGSPSTIVGVEDFKEIKQQYTPMVQSHFKYHQSNKHYQYVYLH